MIPFRDFIKEEIVRSGFYISRANMPQIKDPLGFIQFLESKGITVEWHERFPTESLKSTQVDIDVEKARSMTGKLGEIFVSEDGFVLDGHHRFFAAKFRSEPINIYLIRTTINKCLALAKEYLEE